jgi:hypothetical protein
MKIHLSEPTSFEFCFPQLDTLALVENQRDEVVIHLTRNTFSEERKTYFIRELVGEGFIAEDYRWSSTRTSFSSRRVNWVLDRAWLTPNPLMIAKTRRFMVRLLGGGLLLWFVLMTAMICGALEPALSKLPACPTVGSAHG